MNREIKFRGRRSYDRTWIYGSLVQINNGDRAIIPFEDLGRDGHHICNNSDLPTFFDEETIGQFTGLKDKNGVEIYEGDIVRWDDCSNGRHWRIAIVRINPDIQFDCSIGLSYDGMKSSSKDIFRFGNFIYKDTHNYLEVVGNVFDNPELLKEEKGGKE